MYSLTRTTLVLSLVSSICACASWESFDGQPTYRVSRQYVAKGDIQGVQAHIYGDKTIIKFNDRPILVAVEDQEGHSIDYDNEGEYILLDGIYDSFLVRSNLARATIFISDNSRVPPQNPEPEMKPQKPARKLATDNSPFKIQRPSGPINDGIAHNGDDLLYTQRFVPYGTEFRPSDRNGKLLLETALNAKRIEVRGRTDSFYAGSVDRRIARQRADQARDWLVSNGVDPSVIVVSSLGAGGYAVPNTSPNARNFNRRVEIQISGKGQTYDVSSNQL